MFGSDKSCLKVEDLETTQLYKWFCFVCFVFFFKKRKKTGRDHFAVFKKRSQTDLDPSVWAGCGLALDCSYIHVFHFIMTCPVICDFFLFFFPLCLLGTNTGRSRFHHHRNCWGQAVLLCWGLPSTVPEQKPRWILWTGRHRCRVSDGNQDEGLDSQKQPRNISDLSARMPQWIDLKENIH